MEIKTPEDLTRAIISKQAIRGGLLDHAEQLSSQLATTLHQIDELNNELAALNELQTESPHDPETQDHLVTPQPLSKLDLEPANHPEDT
jgi:hypothetical protein